MLESVVAVVRDPRLTSGFVHESPLVSLPEVTHCGEGVTTSRHTLEPHVHRGFEFLYVCRGDYSWTIGRRTYQQRTSDLFIAYPGQRHATAPIGHPACHQLWLGVDLNELGPEGASLAAMLVAGSHHLIRGCPEVEPLIRGIVLQTVSSAPHPERVVTAYLATLVQVLQQRLLDVGAASDSSVARQSYPVLKAIELMRQNLAERLSLDDLAEAAGIGVSQLCRRFRIEVGQSPADHHRRLRLDEARQQLLNPEASIVDVAVSCGFSSSQHLSKLFRDSFGVTPRQWQHQEGVSRSAPAPVQTPSQNRLQTQQAPSARPRRRPAR